jgi:AAA15 family ATPase/GTPase
MILEIRLSNFFSIKDEVVLDMRAGRSSSAKAYSLQQNVFPYKNEQILKSVALYGANASGKSNIIKAIRFCYNMVLSSHNYNENTKFAFSPFKFDGYPEQPSHFFIRFIADSVEYRYSFSLTTDEILTEELYYYPSGRKAKIFSRDETRGKEKNEIYSFGAVIRKPMDVVENTSRKTLYISRASQMDRDIAKKVFVFFYSKFRYANLGADFGKFYNDNKDYLLKALKIADSDIVNFSLEETEQMRKEIKVDFAKNQATLQDALKKELTFKTYHNIDENVPFDMNEESEGTQALFRNLPCIIDVVRNNKILFIDEIERSLHIKIIEYIIELFHASTSAQVIYTTHNTRLLNLNKLRKDQIYFVNKRENGSSDLYSLFDYKDFRDTMDVEKAYLQGRFDAIPYIDDSPDNLKQLIE